MMATTKKPYMQFSKKVVTAVTAAVTVISVLSIVLCWMGESTDSLVAVVKVYIEYAMVVFAAYSGNSAVEKWLVHRASISDDTDDEEGAG